MIVMTRLVMDGSDGAGRSEGSGVFRASARGRTSTASKIPGTARRDEHGAALASPGEPQQARELLAPVYGWFTEGFGALDLKETKAVLGELVS